MVQINKERSEDNESVLKKENSEREREKRKIRHLRNRKRKENNEWETFDKDKF